MLLLVLQQLQPLLMHVADCQAQTQGHQAQRLAARPPQEVLSGLALMTALSCGLTDHHRFLVPQWQAERTPHVVDLRVGMSEEDCRELLLVADQSSPLRLHCGRAGFANATLLPTKKAQSLLWTQPAKAVKCQKCYGVWRVNSPELRILRRQLQHT